MDKYTDIPLTADLAIYRNMIKDPEIYGEEERRSERLLPSTLPTPTQGKTETLQAKSEKSE